jgi:hypothetical protein
MRSVWLLLLIVERGIDAYVTSSGRIANDALRRMWERSGCNLL